MQATAAFAEPQVTHRLRTPEPLDLMATLSVFRRGGGDPTWLTEGGRLWKTWRTPEGPVTVLFAVRPRAESLETRLWGEGAVWLADHLRSIVGADDDVTGFRAHHPVVSEAWRRFPGWRMPRTGLVIDALFPAILEQKVLGREAFGAYRHLVRRFGEVAPGPGRELGLMVVPSAAVIARVPSWEWLQAGVDQRRSETVMRATALATRLEECAVMPWDEAQRRLRMVPGVGVWTAAEVAQRALGDPDAVSFGDYHIPRNVGWALVGRPVDDDGLAELLQPYSGHRYRVQRLVELVGLTVPRRGPRRSLPTHLPTTTRQTRRPR